VRGAGDGFSIMALLYLIINLLQSEFSIVIIHPALTGNALLWERGQHLRDDVLRIPGDDGIYLLIQRILQNGGRFVHIIGLVGWILVQPHPGHAARHGCTADVNGVIVVRLDVIGLQLHGLVRHAHAENYSMAALPYVLQ